MVKTKVKTYGLLFMLSFGICQSISWLHISLAVKLGLAAIMGLISSLDMPGGKGPLAMPEGGYDRLIGKFKRTFGKLWFLFFLLTVFAVVFPLLLGIDHILGGRPSPITDLQTGSFFLMMVAWLIASLASSKVWRSVQRNR